MPKKSAPPSPYPPELRRRLIELVRAGQTPEELAKKFEPQRGCCQLSNLCQKAVNGARGPVFGVSSC